MIASIKVRTAVPDDAESLAPRLRGADRNEIHAVLGNIDAVAWLRQGIVVSTPCLAVTDQSGLLLALFGANPGEHGEGRVWLLGTPELFLHRFAAGRVSKHWLAILHAHYKVLWNYVDERNEAHVRWLRWCGFELTHRIEDFGVEHRPFYRFEKRDGGVRVAASSIFSRAGDRN